MSRTATTCSACELNRRNNWEKLAGCKERLASRRMQIPPIHHAAADTCRKIAVAANTLPDGACPETANESSTSRAAIGTIKACDPAANHTPPTTCSASAAPSGEEKTQRQKLRCGKEVVPLRATLHAAVVDEREASEEENEEQNPHAVALRRGKEIGEMDREQVRAGRGGGDAGEQREPADQNGEQATQTLAGVKVGAAGGVEARGDLGETEHDEPVACRAEDPGPGRRGPDEARDRCRQAEDAAADDGAHHQRDEQAQAQRAGHDGGGRLGHGRFRCRGGHEGRGNELSFAGVTGPR